MTSLEIRTTPAACAFTLAVPDRPCLVSSSALNRHQDFVLIASYESRKPSGCREQNHPESTDDAIVIGIGLNDVSSSMRSPAGLDARQNVRVNDWALKLAPVSIQVTFSMRLPACCPRRQSR